MQSQTIKSREDSLLIDHNDHDETTSQSLPPHDLVAIQEDLTQIMFTKNVNASGIPTYSKTTGQETDQETGESTKDLQFAEENKTGTIENTFHEE